MDKFKEQMWKRGISEKDIEKYFSVPFNRKFTLRVGELRNLFAQGGDRRNHCQASLSAAKEALLTTPK
jgi:hypothetical protein